MVFAGTMSSNTSHVGHQNRPAMELDHWQMTKRARDREDERLAHEHAAHQEQLDKDMDELYNRRSQLQMALKDVDDNIEFRKAEKQRLLHDYEMRRSMLQSQRQDEDRSPPGWFARPRENILPALSGQENSIHKPSSAMPSHDRALPNPAAAGWTSINGTPVRRSSRVQEQRQEKRSDHGNLFGSVFHNPAPEDAAPSPHALPLRNGFVHPHTGPSLKASPVTDMGVSIRHIAEHSGERVIKPKQERHSLPPFPMGNEPFIESSEAGKKTSRGRKSLPSTRDSASGSNSPAAEPAVTDNQEINRESLILENNGTIVTYPPMFAGVPLEKINENHPFWNPEWEPLERTVQAALDRWKERLESLRQNPDAVRHTMFLANRQVNRGQTVLEFLRNGSFHPLQFASRDVMDKFYKTFVNYDTVFRLVNAHEELRKFDLGIAPLDWLRQRLYEVAMMQGEKFSLSKTIHDLYHDAKLKALREKHGYGNIGRPSGYKVGDKSGGKGAPKLKPRGGAPDLEPAEQSDPHRRGRRSIGQVDLEDESVHLTTRTGRGYLEPATPHLSKRQRLEVGAARVESDDHTHAQEMDAIPPDLDYEGYSSRDSFSSRCITQLDFRVHQMKTRIFTTRTDVKQYWTWKPEEMKFEHQVLRNTHRQVKWGYYREPEKLNCWLKEIKEIRYAADSQKILVARGDESRGDMLVFFRRERTKRRFLVFANKNGIKLLKSSKTHLEEAWDAMNSEVLSDGANEA